ncbi:cytospin-B isoform X1, partial [Pelobates cultripes]
MSGPTPASQWELDLQTSITGSRWSIIISSVRKLIKSAPLIEHQKTIYRWYMVPLRLYKIYPHTSVTCWRCKQDKGSVLHIWWRCPRLIRYWEDTQKIIVEATGIQIPFDPKIFLLLDIPKGIPTKSKKLMYHVLLTAQKLIAQRWKMNETPSIPNLIQE